MNSADRAASRESLRQRITDALESKSSKVNELQLKIKDAQEKISDYETKLKDIESWNHTLKLENKILKVGSKERDERANKAHAILKAENENLKQAIAKLTQQTAEHQLRIRKLASQAGLVAAKKGGNHKSRQ